MKYRIWLEGAWRPITRLIRNKVEVYDPALADMAIVYYAETDGYAVAFVSPADIFEIPLESRPTASFWTPLRPDTPGEPDAPQRPS